MGGGGAGPLLGLTVAALGILALAWLASRWTGGAPLLRGQGGGRFRVLAHLVLGRNERLVLVRFQDQCLLLGVTEHAITLLRELDAEAAAEWLAEQKPPSDFVEILGAVLKKRGRGGDGSQP